MTSLLRAGASVRAPPYVSHCKMPHSTFEATRVFFSAGSCIANCVLEKKNFFEDDKIQSYLCDQQREKERNESRRENQINWHIIRILK